MALGKSPNFDKGQSRSWLSAAAASDLIDAHLRDQQEARQSIIEHAASNLVASRCRRQIIERLSEQPDGTDNAPIDSHFWRRFRDRPERESWSTGQFAARTWETPMGETLDLPPIFLRVFGVEFCEEDLRAAFNLPPRSPPRKAVQISKAPPPIMPLRFSAGSDAQPSYNPRPVDTQEEITPELGPYRPAPITDQLGPNASAILASPINPNERLEDDLARRVSPEFFALRPARPKRENPLTDREIRAWYRGLTRIEKSLGVLALWDLARAAHPGRHLPRKLVAQFGEGRGNGHRARR